MRFRIKKVYRKEDFLENDKWYDIRLELNCADIKCCLDTQLAHDIKDDKFESGKNRFELKL